MNTQTDETYHAPTSRTREVRSGRKAKRSRVERLVENALNGPKAIGTYKRVTPITLFQLVTNEWTTIERGDANQILSIFQPLQFKDAEAILFNNKAPASCTFGSVTSGWGDQTGNFDKLNNVNVKHSSVSLRFKSRMGNPIREQQDIGSEPSTIGRLRWSSPLESAGSRGSRNAVLPLDESTIRSLRDSSSRVARELLAEYSELAIGSLPVPPPPTPTSTRTRLLSPIRALSLARSPSVETPPQIGTSFEISLNPEAWREYPRTYLFVIMGIYFLF